MVGLRKEAGRPLCIHADDHQGEQSVVSKSWKISLFLLWDKDGGGDRNTYTVRFGSNILIENQNRQLILSMQIYSLIFCLLKYSPALKL